MCLDLCTGNSNHLPQGQTYPIPCLPFTWIFLLLDVAKTLLQVAYGYSWYFSCNTRWWSKACFIRNLLTHCMHLNPEVWIHTCKCILALVHKVYSQCLQWTTFFLWVLDQCVTKSLLLLNTFMQSKHLYGLNWGWTFFKWNASAFLEERPTRHNMQCCREAFPVFFCLWHLSVLCLVSRSSGSVSISVVSQLSLIPCRATSGLPPVF